MVISLVWACTFIYKMGRSVSSSLFVWGLLPTESIFTTLSAQSSHSKWKLLEARFCLWQVSKGLFSENMWDGRSYNEVDAVLSCWRGNFLDLHFEVRFLALGKVYLTNPQLLMKPWVGNRCSACRNQSLSPLNLNCTWIDRHGMQLMASSSGSDLEQVWQLAIDFTIWLKLEKKGSLPLVKNGYRNEYPYISVIDILKTWAAVMWINNLVV